MHTAAFCSHPSPDYSPADYGNTYNHYSYSGHSKSSYQDHSNKDMRNSTSLRNAAQRFSGGRVHTREASKTYPGDCTKQNSPMLHVADRYSNGKTSSSGYAAPLHSGRHVEAGPRAHSPSDAELDSKKMSYARRRLKIDPSNSGYRHNGIQSLNVATSSLSTLQPTSSTLHHSTEHSETNRYSQGLKLQGYSGMMQQASPLHLTKQANVQPLKTTELGIKNEFVQKQKEAVDIKPNGATRYSSTEVHVQPPSSHTNSRSPGTSNLPSGDDTILDRDSSKYSYHYSTPKKGNASSGDIYDGSEENSSFDESEQSDYSSDTTYTVSYEHTPLRSSTKPENLPATERNAQQVRFHTPAKTAVSPNNGNHKWKGAFGFYKS